jgi:hypothetical protein
LDILPFRLRADLGHCHGRPTDAGEPPHTFRPQSGEILPHGRLIQVNEPARDSCLEYLS